MTNVDWVCFDCREAVRRPAHFADVPCPKCAQFCRGLGTRIPVPPKRDIRAWRRLQQSLNEQATRFAETQHQQRIRRVHALEQEIKRLEVLPKNPGRVQTVRLLKRRLTRI